MARKETSTEDLTLDDTAVNLDKGEVLAVEGASANDIAKLAADESFASDMLEVVFADANENESPVAEVTVNGIYHCYPRNSQAVHNVPRAAVEVLARSKFMRISTEKRLQPDRSEEMVPIAKYSACYPFTVVRDPAGAKGSAWLRGILSQPA